MWREETEVVVASTRWLKLQSAAIATGESLNFIKPVPMYNHGHSAGPKMSLKKRQRQPYSWAIFY